MDQDLIEKVLRARLEYNTTIGTANDIRVKRFKWLDLESRLTQEEFSAYADKWYSM